ncbi:peptidylprolyl isomerase [Desulfocurvus vexinensis]|uniref:peptidylprolyl isomerase n=1 Tax=Desulfocurvus vexinensis TaxID=399548 RepID=UPI0004B83976|nr:peptidylprolyl isomerase [Desulfocurvus vexinensis]
MRYSRLAPLAALLALCVAMALAACDPKQEDLGVVARVNGRPITLHQLQFKHDFDQLGIAAVNPSVARLKEEYGQALSELVIRELIFQTLAAKGLAVTDEELAAAEANIRTDYPEGAFEEVLVEEYIDINFWRDELRARLSVEKFFAEVLRPGVSIDYREAEQYYQNHMQDFYMPQRVRFVRVSGPSRDVVENALESYKGGGSLEAMAAEFDQIATREIVMRQDRLTKDWGDALGGLKPGEASPVLTTRRGFEALVFSETIPAQTLDPSQAYPLIERELLDRKLVEAFSAWLDAQMAVARITVTPLLEIDPDDRQGEDGTPAQGLEEQGGETDIPADGELGPDGDTPPEADTPPEERETVLPPGVDGKVVPDASGKNN